MNADKLMQTIEAVKIPYGYQMEADELSAIVEAAGGDVLRIANCAARYGFLKGQRAARAEDKKKHREKYRREMKKHAPGYGFLMAIIQANMSNERFIGMMCTRARILEDVLKEKEKKENEKEMDG